MIREQKVTRAERLLSGFCPEHGVAMVFHDAGNNFVQMCCVERQDGHECLFRINIDIRCMDKIAGKSLTVTPRTE